MNEKMINHASQMVRGINSPNYSSGICAAAAASAATKELLLSSSSKEICIRSISDKPNGHNEDDFKKYVNSSSQKFQQIIFYSLPIIFW